MPDVPERPFGFVQRSRAAAIGVETGICCDRALTPGLVLTEEPTFIPGVPEFVRRMMGNECTSRWFPGRSFGNARLAG